MDKEIKKEKWNFIKKNFPKVKEFVGDALPDKGVLGIVKNIISKDEEASPEIKEKALEHIANFEMEEMKQISDRWKFDMQSDSWLSKNVRPITLLYLLLVMTVLVIGDSIENSFKVSTGWVTLIETILVTVIVAYFGGRSAEKWKKIK